MIAIVQRHLVGDAEPAQAMVLDAAMRRAANHAVNLVSLAKQQLRQISAVLPRNSRHQRAFRHKLVPLMNHAPRMGSAAKKRHFVIEHFH